MTIRTSKFGFPLDTGAATRNPSRRTSWRPTFGLHEGRRPETLPPGMAADVQDMIVADGVLRPRDGIRRLSEEVNDLTTSRFDDTNLSQFPVLGSVDVFTSEGTAHIVATSARTASALFGPASSWDTLNYETRPSSDTQDQFWDLTVAFDDARSENIVVATNGSDLPYFMQATSDQTQFSDFTNAASLLSTANAVTVSDNRLVWGGVEDGGVKRLQRIVWSQRGNVQEYGNVGINAGFEDLLDMNGTIQKFVGVDDATFYIFTELEVWRAEARRDSFAFDFFPVEQTFGCPFPQTITQTPGGVIFLGPDLELYAVAGGGAQAIGPPSAGESSRIRRLLQEEAKELKRAFGVYRNKVRQYELYYAAAENSYPDRVLVFDLETRTFWKYTLPVEASDGVNAVLPATTGFGGQSLGGDLGDWRRVFFSSTGTAYEFSNDSIFAAESGADGISSSNTTHIDSRWRSHAIGPGTSYNFISGVEIEYTSDSASSLTVKGSVDGFVSEADTQTVSLQSSDRSLAWIPMRFSGREPQIQVETSEGNSVEFHNFYVRWRRGSRF